MQKSLFLSIRRKCIYLYDYLHHATLLSYNLQSRGYNFNSMNKLAKLVSNIDRDELLPYRKKPEFISK